MSNFVISPNMNLPVPVVGVDPGPDYASNLNSSLGLIDSHNHASGNGVQINPNGININADLPINGNNLTSVRSTRMTAQPMPISNASDLGCTYVSGVDLYYNDENGNQIRITQSGGVAGTPGSIANLTSPASVSYVSADQTFIFESDSTTPGNLDAGSIIFRNITPGSNGITIQPPNSLSSNYTVTLPALPIGQTMALTLSTSGNLAPALITTPLLATSVSQALNPPGSILAFGGTSIPTGYLLCDGTAVSRTTYSALFTAIASNYGHGDGSTTFNLPDFRGLFLRGVSGSSGQDPDASSRTALNTGGNTGNNVGSFQSSNFASHSHTDSGHQHYVGRLSNQVFNGSGGNGLTYTGSSDLTAITEVSGANIQATGGNESRGINAYVNYIIKI